MLRDGVLEVEAVFAGEIRPVGFAPPGYRGYEVSSRVERALGPGPPTSTAPRATGFAELTLLQEGALDAAGFERAAHLGGEREAAVFLDNVVMLPGSQAGAGARVVDRSGHRRAATGRGEGGCR